MVGSWFPDRPFVVAGDRAYGGGSVLQKLPANIDLISHVHPKGRLYQPAPTKESGKRGRNRKKGDPLPGMAEWAKDPSQRWQRLRFDQFGFHATVEVKRIKALYYTAGKDRMLRIVLVRDLLGKRPDQMSYCTRLEWNARKILSTYALRWAIKVTFENCEHLLGFQDSANRTKKAVGRTAPMALVIDSPLIVRFDKEGLRHWKLPDRPWYPQKNCLTGCDPVEPANHGDERCVTQSSGASIPADQVSGRATYDQPHAGHAVASVGITAPHRKHSRVLAVRPVIDVPARSAASAVPPGLQLNRRRSAEGKRRVFAALDAGDRLEGTGPARHRRPGWPGVGGTGLRLGDVGRWR